MRLGEIRRKPQNGPSSQLCVFLVVHKPMVPIGLSGPAAPWRHEDGAHGKLNEPTYCNRTATGPVREGTQWDERRFGETKNRVHKPGNET